MWSKAISISVDTYPKRGDKNIQYGTAGFRANADSLDWIMFRMGILASIYSKYNRKAVGVMITASHNPECDNGVKIINPMGDMMELDWETVATDLVSVTDDKLGHVLDKVLQSKSIDIHQPALVLLGRDTRESSPKLLCAVMRGAYSVPSSDVDYRGVVTTPQLHYLMRCLNTWGGYGEATLRGYLTKLSTAFNTLIPRITANTRLYTPQVWIDGANGVGAMAARQLAELVLPNLKLMVFNEGGAGHLNEKCGADYVKVQQKSPDGEPAGVGDGEKCCSVDGDCDRLIYYYRDGDGVFHLVDGDKMACLVASHLVELLKSCDLTAHLSLGLVQTAYANGSSSRYMTDVMKVPVSCTPTGVKHLHHKAIEFDVGIYFEANGHGTVVFSEKACRCIDEKRSSDGDGSPADNLYYVMQLINQTVGDALSDMLLIEYILCVKDWDIKKWDDMYKDLPNRQLKVKVKDRKVFETTDAERRLVKPDGLQTAIDEAVGHISNGRSFVRPSGTEEVVRVYAEAGTQVEADNLADQPISDSLLLPHTVTGSQYMVEEINAAQQAVNESSDNVLPLAQACNQTIQQTTEKCAACIANKCTKRLEDIASSCADPITQILMGAINFVNEVGSFFTNSIPNFIVDEVGGHIINGGQEIASFFTGTLFDGLQQIGNNIGDIGQQLGGAILDVGDIFQNIGTNILGGILDAGNFLIGTTLDIGNALGDFFGNLGSNIGNIFGGLGRKRRNLYLKNYRHFLLLQRGEPGCDDFKDQASAEKACLYYATKCSDCQLLQDEDSLCPDYKEALGELLEVAEDAAWLKAIKELKFGVNRVSYNPASFDPVNIGYTQIEAEVDILGYTTTFQVPEIINVFDSQSAGPVIGKNALDWFKATHAPSSRK